MLTTPKLQLMQELIAGSTREELIWLSGYLAGVVAQITAAQGASAQGTAALAATPGTALDAGPRPSPRPPPQPYLQMPLPNSPSARFA